MKINGITRQRGIVMHTWYKTILGNRDILHGKHFDIQNTFEEIFATMKSPDEMAMFRNTVDKQTYYFIVPTGSESFMNGFFTNYSAKLCFKPEKSECSLLVGDQRKAMTWLN